MTPEERAEQVFNSLQYFHALQAMEYLADQFREVANQERKECAKIAENSPLKQCINCGLIVDEDDAKAIRSRGEEC
jgi:succinate dehydrogenase/fumarate reductase-like Fe-S protein